MFYIHVIHVISQITQTQTIHYLFKQLFLYVLCSLYTNIDHILFISLGDIDILLDSP